MQATEENKNEAIDSLKLKILASAAYLAGLRKTSQTREEWKNLYPMFDDVTIKDMLDNYDKIENLRGW